MFTTVTKLLYVILFCIFVECIYCIESKKNDGIFGSIPVLTEGLTWPNTYVNLTDSNSEMVVFPDQTINKSVELKFIYEIDAGAVFDEGKAFHIEFSVSKNVPKQCPILFSIFQQQQIVPVALPYKFDKDSSDTVFFEAGRTMCTSSPDQAVGDGRNITVHVTTCSDYNVTFNITAQLKDDLLLSISNNTSNFSAWTIVVGPTTPQYLVYKFPKDDTHPYDAKIILESEDKICMIVSIQSLYCPIYEQEVDVKYPSGLYKTMTKRSVVEVKQDDYPEGFTIVFVVKHDNKECLELSDQNNGTRLIDNNNKKFTVHVEKVSDSVDTQRVTAFFMPAFFSIVVAAFTLLCYRLHQNYLREWTTHLSTEDRSRLLTSNGAANDPNVIEEENDDDETEDSIQSSPSTSTQSQTSVSTVVPKRRTLYLNDFNVRKELKSSVNDEEGSSAIKMKTGVDHSRKKHNPHHFWSTLLLVSIFYAIPVYELVINFLITLNTNGDYDYCFFNELCSHRFGPILDANHYFSNASYFLLGIIFCMITKWKAKSLNQIPSTKGIGCQKEIFYGLGIALMMEGIFSGAYHLCPNKFTFQYDTTFMYVVSSLVLLKLFLSRHPIKHFTASKTYTGLAMLVTLTAISYLVDISSDTVIKKTFCYLYLIAQTLVMFCFAIYYCDVGLIKNDEDFGNAEVSPIIIWNRLKYCFCFVFYRKSPFLTYGEKYPFIWVRAITPFLVMCTSIAVFTLLTEIDEKGFATILLFTIVTVTIICTSSYIFCKCCYKEFQGEKKKLFLFPTMCFTLCIAFGAFAVYFFGKTSYDSDDSPAASRSKNQSCIFLMFYDAHDMWHMLSSISLFIGYMGLLTMDDNLARTPLEKIHVF